MTLDDILMLGKMGYSKDDIAALAGTQADNEQQETEQQETEQQETEQTENNNQFEALKASVDALTKAVQASNVKNASMGSDSDAPSVDDVIKKMIGGK